MLNNGNKMPQVGLGMWKIPKDCCADAVVDAVDAGYRLFDSACDYGNEKQTGEGLRRVFESGKVKREDLFIVSKLWNTFHHPDHVKLAVKKTLADFGLEYLDLYLIHFPIALKFVPIETRYPPEWLHDPSAKFPRMEFAEGVTYQMTYQAMEELVAEGLVRNIGVSNVGTLMLSQILQYCKIKPAVLQVEMHPLLTQEKLLRYCREHRIQTMAFSNFGAASYIELNMATAAQTCFDTPIVQALAAKYNKTPGQIILRWGVQRGTTVIPKTIKKERLIENISLFDFALTQEEMKEISALNQNKRFNDPGHFCELAFNTFCPIYD